MSRLAGRLGSAGPVRTVLVTLAVAAPVVAVLAALAVHVLADEQRAAFEAGALGETRSVLVAAPADIDRRAADQLSRALRRPERLEAVVVAADGGVGRSSGAVDVTDVPVDLRARTAPPALARTTVAGEPVLVVGGATGPGTTRLFLFFSERPLAQQQDRTVLLVASAASLVLLLVAAGGWRRSTRRARALAELREQEQAYMGHLAHELRTPVGALVTAASLVPGQHLRGSPAELRRPVEIMQDQSRRLRTVVEDLLELSRLEAGHVQPRPESVDLAQVVSEVVSGYGWDDVAVDADGPTLVHADRQSLARVALNLIGNARRHGDGRVRVSVHPTSRGAVLQVSDDGPGLEEERVDVLTGRARGSGRAGRQGLGLMITRAHADLLGARIEVDTPPGAGTRVRVELPPAHPLPGAGGSP